MNESLSHTSNTVKLLKHLDKLKAIQNGYVPAPIMLHTMPTHRCQLSCEHCCFKNRQDFQLDIDPYLYMLGVTQYWMLGTRAIELTGGGEPTLYPHIQKCLEYFLSLNLKIGLITNGLSLDRISYLLPRLAWVRVSLNTLDYKPPTALRTAMNLLTGSGTHFSFCYIWNKHSATRMDIVTDFINTYKATCRLSPDCIQSLSDIEAEMETIRTFLREKKYKCPYLFLSDFNTTLTRRNSNCYIHMLKPALYTDGHVYPCPSAELAMENNKSINEKFAICHASEIYAFYNAPNFRKILDHSCSYCKYSLQQSLIEDVMTRTDFNEFA
jgi:MoaA/NifB/PqqE/SkfB family radical SAM enzyme